ncbi:anthrax toxin lethal factor-related metalloendopeptidase [Peribacillus glennii]|uniref:Toxin n=1 Tax=Peribacillus glennii TaxID=2303991 RepID=A0A372LGN2_9BACI|nr:toxin [Peribacillus glennii]RFU65455.1 toxin [Peribacillus glennii]
MYVKKLAVVVAVSVFLFSFYSFTYASEEGITWNELSGSHPLKQMNISKSNKNLMELFLFSSTSFDSDEALLIIETVGKLPPFMIDRLLQNDVRVKLFTGSLTDNKSARHLKGQVPRGYKDTSRTWDDVPGMGGSRNVLVKIGASRKGSGHGSVSLELHELAHTIDTILYGRIREDKDFLKIWRKEAPILFPGESYFLQYPEEYFAESFAMYYKDKHYKSLVNSKAPETFLYIEHLK